MSLMFRYAMCLQPLRKKAISGIHIVFRSLSHPETERKTKKKEESMITDMQLKPATCLEMIGVLDMQTTSKKRTQLMTHRCSGRDSERSRHVQPGHCCHLQCHEELQEPAPNLLRCACTYLHTQTLQGKERMAKMKVTKTTEEQKTH